MYTNAPAKGLKKDECPKIQVKKIRCACIKAHIGILAVVWWGGPGLCEGQDGDDTILKIIEIQVTVMLYDGVVNMHDTHTLPL
jgi:hypothetical protein